MGSFASENRTFFYNLKRYGFTLSKEEVKQIIITTLLIAFIWSFNKWGTNTFDFLEGIKNFSLGALYALIVMFFFQLGQRVVAVHYGYDPIYEYGMFGLMIGLVITFASRGYLIFFLPGVINLRHLAASRLGEFRYYTNDWEWAKICFMGPVMSIMLAIFLSPFKENFFASQLMLMSILYSVYSLLPLPGNLGLPLMYPHIYFWTFTLGIVGSAILMVFFLPFWLTLILCLLFGIIAMYVHYAVIDKKF